MNTKFVYVIVILATIFGGIAGAIVSCYLLPGQNSANQGLPDKVKFTEIEADKITANRVTANIIVSKGTDNGIICRMANGEIQASKTITAASIKGNYLVGNRVLVASNPVAASLQDHKIYIELAAIQESGGLLIVRDKESALVPAKGGINTGHTIVIGYDKHGAPVIYSHDIKKGKDGRTFLLRYVE